ncbi:MAG: hypothetical protein IJB54_08000 [Firmicutes bacterium]|nr:hypothetical protein [Bacillota bacterium]
MKKVLKVLILWFIMGALYFTLEGFWRIPSGGYANIIMLPIGGLCGILIGSLNQYPRFYNSKVIYQCLISTVIVLLVEFISGCIVNLWLGLNIWDYSHRPLNIMGQVCIQYGLLWFAISPLAIWLEDALRYKLWGEGEYYSISSIYKELLHLN